MAENNLNPYESDIMNVKEKSLYARLRTLFSSSLIVRNKGGKQIKNVDTDNIMYATDRNSLRDRFNRIRSTSYNSYSRDFALSYQAARMDLFRDYDCIGPDTIIPLPDGTYPTIAELTEKYKDSPQERFNVFSYDHESDSIKLGRAFHPRKKKGTRVGYKVTFDNGQHVIGSIKHPFLMRDGEYKTIYDLEVGDSVMPFYQKDFYKQGYRHLYNFSKGWQSEHKVVAEQFQRELLDNEVVHHKDFDKTNNSPDNLQIMLDADHRAFHMKLNNEIIWSPENKPKTLEKIRNSDGYKNRKFHKWDGERSGKNNPFHGKSHSYQSNEKRSNSLKETFIDRDQSIDKNPNYRKDLTIELLKFKAVDYYKEHCKLDIHGFAKEVGCDYSSIKNRIPDWNGFKKDIVSTLNHKIVSIEEIGPIDVYDVTVDKYHNFATDVCFVKNTMDMDPILASALDIYADECLTVNEMGKILTVHSPNHNVKDTLENLFNKVLNIQHNLWSWTRNMCKYGDFFLKLYITPKYGIYMVDPISAYNVERIENSDPYNKRYVKFQLRPTDTSQAEIVENYEMAHFRLMSDSNFLPYGKCLDGNSIVSTTLHPKKIKDIRIGDKVYSFDFEFKKVVTSKVVNTIMSGTKLVYEIKTCHRQINATPEHPFLLSDGTYKQVKDLTVDDFIVLPTINNSVNINYPSLIVEETNDWKYDSKLNIISEEILKNNFKEFVRFFGFLLGDGWLDKSNNTVAFCIGTRIDKSQKYLDFIKTLNINIRLTNGLNPDSSCIINSVYLFRLLQNLGFITGTNNKEIPDWVWSLPLEYKQELLFGFTDADGCDIDDNTFQLGTINESLLDNLRQLAMECGLSVTKKWITNKSGYSDNCRMCLFTYRLKSRDFIEIENGHHIERIREISKGSEVEVYDIQVDNLLHNFISDGVVVHNSVVEGARRVWKQLSLMEDAMLIHRIMRAPEKRIFYTDIGNIPPNEVDAYMQKQKDMMKKVPYMDEMTGEYNLRFNLMNMVEDYFIAVRGSDSGTKIDTLGGMDWTGTEDIEYLRNKLMAALKIPKAFLGYEEGLCVSPLTEIPLMNGMTKTVKELIEDYEQGIQNYVYSIDERTHDIVPGEIEWAGFTRLDSKVVRVHLDNGKYIDCTPDHTFMTRDGKWVESKDLHENQALMPLYLDETTNKYMKGYTTVYNPSTETYKLVHNIVSAHFNLKEDGKVCHHLDFNKNNNYPTNLNFSMDFWEHRNYHSKLSEKTINSSENIKKRITDPQWIKSAAINGKKGGLISGKKLGIWVKNNGPANKGNYSGIQKKCPLCNSKFYTVKSENKTTCSNKCSSEYFEKYNTKYKISLEKLCNIAKECSSFKDIEEKMGGIDRNTLNRIFEYNDINKYEFIYSYMPNALKNVPFMNNVKKYKNHVVVSVEVLDQKIDTCDLRIKNHHNFATGAGVIIHNSGKATLAAEDVRFARTIQRVQRILTSELTKIAIVHLYAQGYRDESLVDFELELTNPSTIFEQEKIAIWSEKVDVSMSMMESKLFSRKWIYKNVFNMSDDDILDVQKEVVEDVKQDYRFNQITDEGNDPASGFGGGGGGKMGGLDDEGDEELPDELSPDDDDDDEGGEDPTAVGADIAGSAGSSGGAGGAIKETKAPERDQSGEHKASDHPFGEDPLGFNELHPKEKKNSEGKPKSPLRHNFEGGSPLSVREGKSIKKPKSELMTSLSLFNEKSQKEIKKELLSETHESGSKKSILDETNILE